MTPLTEAVTELRLLVAHAEDMTPGVSSAHAHLDDYRTEVLGDLFELLDQLDSGLGTRLMLAMYPLSDAQAAALLANGAVGCVARRVAR